jgi:hypothetical protein
MVEQPKSGEAPSEAQEPPRPESAEATGGLTGRVKRGLVQIAKATYDARADDLQERAIEAMREALVRESERLIELAKTSYDDRADDLEQRAARALRAALIHESRRIQALIEHSVTVKRKEVRLSLLVLVVANLIYLAVYWITGR